MRIIAGEFKSRKIIFPKEKTTRPLTDRAKETIFNVLGNLVDDRRVLDLFAGSGSFGLEALSRGAKEVCFVDWAPEAKRCVLTNLTTLGLSARGTFLERPILKALKKLEKEGEKFDLIFLDPPHNKGLIKNILNHLDASDIVAPFAIVVVGHSNLERLPEGLASFQLIRSVQIGQTFASFLQKGGQNAQT